MILARTDSERIFMGKPKGGDQTEKPTPKRLKDARKEGEVHRSQELTNTLLLMLWLAMAPLLAGWVYQHLADAFEASFIGVGRHRPADLLNTLQLDLMLLMRAVLPLLIFASVVGIAADFLQLGPLFALKRLVPKMERINPVDGVKRMFSQENLVEVFKSIFKSAALLGIGVLVLRAMLPPILSLPDASPPDILRAWWRSLMWIGIWVVFVFFFVSVLDANYQRFVFIRNLMMSRRDIRDEVKTTEGDPMVKSRRRELHHEWSQQNMLASVRKSNVVVVNPTHIAVALSYEPGETDLPVVSAKGEGYEARLIREAAEQAGVPVLQNIDLARGLHANVAVDEYISADFFEAVAEILRWAESMRGMR